MRKSRLYLIDATAFCYRAYYALKGLATSSGQPTNAIFGFVNFLNKILKQENPEYLGICFDVSRDTFRKRKFAEYKIQRPQMPEALMSQIPIIKQIIRAYGIIIYEKHGFEADDLIASLSKKARQTGLDVMIISSDKDILQLVDEHIVVLSPYKNKGTVYDSKKIEEVFGIKPAQVIDFIALTGDSADNIPAVKGVGEKTAVKLIQDFKSIDGILTNLNKISSQKLQNTLKESIQKISLNRSIVKLKDDVDLEFDLEELKLKEPDNSALYNIFRQLEFKSLLGNLSAENNPSINSGSYPWSSMVDKSTSISEFRNIKEIILMYQNERLAILSIERNIFTELKEEDFGNHVRDLLSNAKIKKIGHNLKELRIKLNRRKVRLEGLCFDTMIAAYLLNSSRAGYSLAYLSWEYLKENFDDRRIQLDVACLVIFKLKTILEGQLYQKGLESLFFNLEMPLVNVLADMELIGVAVDLEFLKSLSSEIEGQLISLVDKIYQLSEVEFNINSPKQLRNILFERLKLPVIKKTKSGPSTDEEVLSVLAKQHPLPKILLEYRKLTKIKSTYIDALPLLVDSQSKRIHASFNQTGTQTGRLSSSNPNLQNLPIRGEVGRQIRKAIIAYEPHYSLVSFDYSQIELRILAHLSEDPQLVKAFQSHQDIHVATASLIYGLDQKDISPEMREIAKRVNFGIVYGLSSFGLSRDLGISQEEASNFIDAYFLRYPKVKDYIQKQIQKAKEDGYITTISGRRRYIPEINSTNSGIRQFAERQAINTPIQGSAADLIKKAMIDIHREIQNLGLKSKLILQVHDELVFEVAESEVDLLIKLVRQKMEDCFTFNIPIKVVIKKGRNWLEMEEIE